MYGTYEIIDGKSVLYSFDNKEEATELFLKFKNNEFAIQIETFGDVKLVEVLDITK